MSDIDRNLRQVIMDLANRIDKLEKQTLIVRDLAEVSNDLGLVIAGEFRAQADFLNPKEPGEGFSGVRISGEGAEYNGEVWNIAGVNNDVLQVGIKSTDGTLVAGGGNVRIDATGMELNSSHPTGDPENAIEWYNAVGDLTGKVTQNEETDANILRIESYRQPKSNNPLQIQKAIAYIEADSYDGLSYGVFDISNGPWDLVFDDGSTIVGGTGNLHVDSDTGESNDFFFTPRDATFTKTVNFTDMMQGHRFMVQASTDFLGKNMGGVYSEYQISGGGKNWKSMDDDHPGQVTLTSTTTANSGNCISTDVADLKLDYNKFSGEIIFKPRDVNSNNNIVLGAFDQTNANTTPNNGYFAIITGNGTNFNISGRIRVGNATIITTALGTLDSIYYRIRFDFMGADGFKFNVWDYSGTLICSFSNANAMTANRMAFGAKAWSANATSRSLIDLDRMDLFTTLDLWR